MIEIHPFPSFVPPNAKYLILGSFSGRQHSRASSVYLETYDFYYGTPRNQFWTILGKIYQRELTDIDSKKALLSDLKIAIADIILQCKRKAGTNSDANLVSIVYKLEEITGILSENPIEKIYFTSRFTESKFRRNFSPLIRQYPRIQLITLPSPSPRYARMTFAEKVDVYRELLPREKNPRNT
jgi:hypoxanthine-DNA glycosylase